MKKIRFMLEYNCIPIWLYDSDDNLIGPGIPEEMVNDYEFVEMVNEIKDEFDSLYENTDVNFEYLGFIDEHKKQAFFTKASKVIDLLKNEVSRKYLIQVDFKKSDY